MRPVLVAAIAVLLVASGVAVVLARWRVTVETFHYDNPAWDVRYEESPWRRGTSHGAYECRYANGQLREAGSFRNGVAVGRWHGWYASGVRRNESFHDPRGRTHGVLTEFDEEGEVTVQKRYVHGEFDDLKVEAPWWTLASGAP